MAHLVRQQASRPTPPAVAMQCTYATHTTFQVHPLVTVPKLPGSKLKRILDYRYIILSTLSNIG